MHFKHSLTLQNTRIIDFSALKCRMLSKSAWQRVIVMRFSHLILRRTIDFCSAAI